MDAEESLVSARKAYREAGGTDLKGGGMNVVESESYAGMSADEKPRERCKRA